jgi:ABC-2 type transport system ATP-binding protein
MMGPEGVLVTSVIDVAHLRKRYGSLDAVDGVSFSVDEGEIFGLLGPNGAGKTTTVEIVQGLRHADAGTVSVLGLDPAADATELRRRIGSQLQESALPARIKVWEALDLFGSLAERRTDPGELLERWGLADKRDAAFANLSGGQRQRLFVALALVADPEVVFLDEMTTGLDPAARRVTWRLIQEVRARGTTVVLVTHFMDEAERLCDRLAVMRGGRIVAEGTPQGLVNRYAPEIRVRFGVLDGCDVGWLADLSTVRSVERWGTRVEVEGVDPVLAEVAGALMVHGLTPADLRVEQPTLEDVFLRLTEEVPA